MTQSYLSGPPWYLRRNSQDQVCLHCYTENTATVSMYNAFTPLWGDTQVRLHSTKQIWTQTPNRAVMSLGSNLLCLCVSVRHVRQTSFILVRGMSCVSRMPHIPSSLLSIIMRHVRTNCSCSPVFFLFFFRLLRRRSRVYMVGFLPHMGNTGTSTLFLWAFFCKAVQVPLLCVYMWFPWRPTTENALTPVHCQVLYIALCLRAGKVPLI